ncbi:hypothetical protein [Dankookia sp. P2]|uniref:hypothetical protein n=1 Tax=Dankookia sp. P2 TaxID=3423955 RepID=UPI003D678F14
MQHDFLRRKRGDAGEDRLRVGVRRIEVEGLAIMQRPVRTRGREDGVRGVVVPGRAVVMRRVRGVQRQVQLDRAVADQPLAEFHEAVMVGIERDGGARRLAVVVEAVDVLDVHLVGLETGRLDADRHRLMRGIEQDGDLAGHARIVQGDQVGRVELEAVPRVVVHAVHHVVRVHGVFSGGTCCSAQGLLAWPAARMRSVLRMGVLSPSMVGAGRAAPSPVPGRRPALALPGSRHGWHRAGWRAVARPANGCSRGEARAMPAEHGERLT